MIGGTGQTSLQRAIVGIQPRGTLQGIQTGGDVGPVEMELVHSTPQQQKKDESDAQESGRRAVVPATQRKSAATRLGCAFVFRRIRTFVEQQRGDAGIAEFPDCAVQNEVMNVDERREGQKAGGKIGVEQAAGEPRSGNEKRDAAGDQRQKIAWRNSRRSGRRHALLCADSSW